MSDILTAFLIVVAACVVVPLANFLVNKLAGR